MTKPNFIEQIIDILDESHYESDSLKWIVKECKKYFDEYKNMSIEELSEMVQKKIKQLLINKEHKL